MVTHFPINMKAYKIELVKRFKERQKKKKKERFEFCDLEVKGSKIKSKLI